jgi:hypothetical protein
MTNAAAKTPAKVTCPACNGRRYINGFESIADGICFTCNGSGVVSINHRAARAEVLTPAQIEARAEAAKLGAVQAAFVATFAGLDAATIADRFVNLSDAKVSRLRDVAMNRTGPGAAELEKGAFETLDRRGFILRRAA